MYTYTIAVQLQEGHVEDAESQIELLSVMQSAEELSPEFLYLRYDRQRDIDTYKHTQRHTYTYTYIHTYTYTHICIHTHTPHALHTHSCMCSLHTHTRRQTSSYSLLFLILPPISPIVFSF